MMAGKSGQLKLAAGIQVRQTTLGVHKKKEADASMETGMETATVEGAEKHSKEFEEDLLLIVA